MLGLYWGSMGIILGYWGLYRGYVGVLWAMTYLTRGFEKGLYRDFVGVILGGYIGVILGFYGSKPETLNPEP